MQPPFDDLAVDRAVDLQQFLLLVQQLELLSQTDHGASPIATAALPADCGRFPTRFLVVADRLAPRRVDIRLRSPPVHRSLASSSLSKSRLSSTTSKLALLHGRVVFDHDLAALRRRASANTLRRTIGRKLPLPSSVKSVRHQARGGDDAAATSPEIDERLGQRRAEQPACRLPDRPPHRHQEQALRIRARW